MKPTAHKAAGCLMALLLVQALLTSGVSFTRGIQAFDPDKKPVLVSLDVCGHGAASAAAGGFEITFSIPASTDFRLPAFSSYPPTPDMAVATAEAGETEKPPEA
jgi:hypothetical protein